LSIIRRLGAAAPAICLGAALAACSTAASSAAPPASSATSASASQKITIAGVFENTSDPFWVTIGCGAAAEGKRLGITVDNFSTTTLSTSAVSADFSAAQQTRPNGIFSDLLTANQFITQYKKLMADGVPVVDGNPTTPPEQEGVVWTSPTTSSSSFLPSVLSLIPSETGDMAVLGGVPGLVPVDDRFVPLVAAIHAARPGLTVLPTEYSGFTTNTATQYVTATLLSHPDLKLIVVADGPDAAGVVSALQAAHKTGKVEVIALDAIPPEVTALKTGAITALIAQQPAKIGAEQVEALVNYVKSHKSGAVPASAAFTGVPQVLLTKANVNNPGESQYFYETSCS
jgi:ribose transport system substrate-binding protein